MSTAKVQIGQRLCDDFGSIVDQRDQEIAEATESAYLAGIAETGRPRVGEWCRINGKLRRFAHDWDDSLQWTDNAGSFHIGMTGHAGMSGSLESPEPADEFFLTDEWHPAGFWFFHHTRSGAHRGVQMTMAVRVWELRPKDGREVLSCRESLERKGIKAY